MPGSSESFRLLKVNNVAHLEILLGEGVLAVGKEKSRGTGTGLPRRNSLVWIFTFSGKTKKVRESLLFPRLLSQHLSFAPWSNLLCPVTVISPT